LTTRSFIIALTGNARREQVQSARDAGVDDVMIKVRKLRTGSAGSAFADEQYP
jgi:CheY-like chemotaxis protein